MTGMLAPEYKEVVLGHIEVRETFKVPNIGVIAGGYVKEGKVVRNAQVRLAREGIIIHEGQIASLRRFKDDVKEVATGYECGISIENYNDIKEGDIIEAFIIEEIPRG
jgi:translation initiation factor IF-2